MKDLIDRYRRDELTPNELMELKRQLGTLSDADLEKELYPVWADEEQDNPLVNDITIARIKGNIDTEIRHISSRKSLFIRVALIAATILLPLFMLFTVYLYRENSLILSDEVVISTGKAERAGITLPDGSVVALNAESRLGYLPKSYNKRQRAISFNGEGYFRVHQNSGVPFLIHSNELQVKVLGTTFNLSVRNTNLTAEVELEEGSVMLTSVKSKKSVVLQKEQKAILNYSTGEITVAMIENPHNIAAWQRGDMIFRNTGLLQVIHAIEENYNVNIRIEKEEYLNDTFTGILPVNDLNEVFEVLERSYQLKAVISGKEIVLSAVK